jgi:hypothetical protein
MNANQITFGIEIETTLPSDSPVQVGPYHVGSAIPGLPGWTAMHDGSIRAGHGRRGCEFVSPVYSGAQGLRQMIADIETIKATGATVNASCGLHVHVGFDKNNRVALEKLITLAANFEQAIYASTGTKNRERGQWCGSVQRHGSFDRAESIGRVRRYHVVNIATTKPTVEFRAFSGSLNPQKIVGYVMMCVALVERAHAAKRVTSWSAKPVSPTSPIKRSGDGQTAVTRLFYQLGWIKGRTDYTYGNLITPGTTTLQRVKRGIMKLARKYDAQP